MCLEMVPPWWVGDAELVPVGPRKGQEQPCVAEKRQSRLARLCEEDQPCLWEKPICRYVPSREKVRPARAVLDELLGRGSVARILEEPGLGERREVTQEKKYQKQPGEHSQGHWGGLQRWQRWLGRARLISTALAGEMPFLPSRQPGSICAGAVTRFRLAVG